MAGQYLLLSLWTLWLLIALPSIGGRAGVILVSVFAVLALGLVLPGVLSWRAYVIAWLIVHMLAAAVRVFAQYRPQQLLSGSVSLGGLVWLLILRPTVPWLYPADIPIMIVTVVALVAAECGCWVLYERAVRERIDRAVARAQQEAGRRVAAVEDLLQEERQLRWDREAAGSARRDALAAELSRAQDDLRGTQDDLRRTQDDLRRTQDELRRTQDELQRTQDELQRTQDELQRTQDELALALEAAESQRQDESLVWYRGPADARLRARSERAAQAGTVRVEMVRIAAWLRPGPGGSDGDPAQLVGTTIERRTVPVTPGPGETVSEATRTAAERLGQGIKAATAQYAAEEIGGPTWKIVSERWVADGSPGFDAAAGTVADFDAAVHNILLGKPVQQLSSWAGLPGPLPAVLGGVAGAAELPIDRPLNAVRRIIQVGGIVVSVISGNPVLASACFKSLVHDELIHGLEAGIERTLSKFGASPVGERASAESVTARGAAAEPLAERAAAVEAAEQAAAERAAAERAAAVQAATKQAAAERAADERAAAERAAAERAAAERAAVERAARFFRGPYDSPGPSGPPSAGPRISPF
jgi:hypothetical protein